MNLVRYSLVLFAAGCFAGTAQGSLITYDLTGASTSAGALTGTVAIDRTTGLIESANLALDAPSWSMPVFTTVASTAADNGMGQGEITGTSTGPQNYGGQAALYFDTANLSTGGSLQLCTAGAICGRQGIDASYIEVYSKHGTQVLDLSSGTLAEDNPEVDQTQQQSATTPEPLALLLVGTGHFCLRIVPLEGGLSGVASLRAGSDKGWGWGGAHL